MQEKLENKLSVKKLKISGLWIDPKVIWVHNVYYTFSEALTDQFSEKIEYPSHWDWKDDK